MEDDLSPVSTRTLILAMSLSALASCGLFYLLWREEVHAAFSRVRNGGRALVDISAEPGQMMADVREAISSADDGG